MSFTQQDHEDLERAAEIVNRVTDRHPSADLRVISALCAVIQGIRVAERIDANPTKT